MAILDVIRQRVDRPYVASWAETEITPVTARQDILAGHGVRGGKAMIATLRCRLIAIPGRLTRHARHLILRLHPATACSPKSSPGYGRSPHCPDHLARRP